MFKSVLQFFWISPVELEKEISKIQFKQEMEAVLFHIWARSVLAASSRDLRRGWFAVLILEPFMFILLLIALLRQTTSIKNFGIYLVSMPASIMVEFIEMITGGFFTKLIAKKYIGKKEQFNPEGILKFGIKFIVAPSIAFMNSDCEKESNSFTDLQANPTEESMKELDEKIRRYWAIYEVKNL